MNCEKNFNHGGNGRSVTNFCNPFTGPPIDRVNNNIKESDDRYVFAFKLIYDYLKILE